ncbi:MAG: thioredoxin domain-containing protein [Steroidobacteraceae bacterium]
MKLVLERFANRVLFAYRHFPQEAIHRHALRAAEAAECAGSQGRFWAMHDRLFANQAHLEQKHLFAYAEQLELDTARFRAEMDDEVYLQRIREHLDGGRLSHVRATPGFFVNGRIVDVSFGLRALFDAVEAAL